MENFEIELQGKTYTIKPEQNGYFQIFDGIKKIDIIYPEAGDLVIEWKSVGKMQNIPVNRIGEMISARLLDSKL